MDNDESDFINVSIKYNLCDSCKDKSIITNGISEGVINNKQQASKGINRNIDKCGDEE